MWFNDFPSEINMILSHDSPMFFNDFPMMFPCFSHDFPMCFLWFSYVFPKMFPMFSHVFPMILLCFSKRFSYDFPMCFLYDFPMFFQRFSHRSATFLVDSPAPKLLHRAQRSARCREVRRGGTQLPSTAPQRDTPMTWGFPPYTIDDHIVIDDYYPLVN